MLRVEVHFRGGSVMEVDVEDFGLVKLGHLHKPTGLDFDYSEEAKQYVMHLDFDEVVAVKYTKLDAD